MRQARTSGRGGLAAQISLLVCDIVDGWQLRRS
jgi:hypothetical protein